MSTRSALADAASPVREPAWHDVENGAYLADLALWEQLAAEAAGPVLELGAGTGRVALRLAAAGAEVTALDSSELLLAELSRRAGAAGLAVETIHGDVLELELELEDRFALVIAPMQLAHLFDGPGRRRLFELAARVLRPGGAAAFGILADGAATLSLSGASPPPLPDVRELHGWVYSSQPVEVVRDRGAIVVRRLRQLVSPAGELSEMVDVTRLEGVSAAKLESEAAAGGLEPRERFEVPATDDHVGSTVVVTERPS